MGWLVTLLVVTAIRPPTGPAAPAFGLGGQLWRFVAVGVLAAAVDFGTYSALLAGGVWVHLARGLSFGLGTTTAYLLNRRFAFAASHGGAGRFTGFLALYATTLALNIGVNALALTLLPAGDWRVALAWVMSQGVATAVNFVVLRTVIFRA